MKYKVLLADADGTLFDFLKGEQIALTTVLKFFKLPSDDETIRLYSSINDEHWKRMERGETTQSRLRVERFEDFLSALNASGDAVKMSQEYVKQLGQQRILIPGAEAFCQAVSAHMPIYLVTNGISAVQRSRFENCVLSSYLTDILISEEIGHAKPEPDMLLKAISLAGIADPSLALMLGDSISADIGAAKNAGIDSCLFTNGKPVPLAHGATYVVQTLEEARKIIFA